MNRIGGVDGLRDNGAIGAPEEPAVFRSNTRALRVLRDSSTSPSLRRIQERGPFLLSERGVCENVMFSAGRLFALMSLPSIIGSP